MKKQTKTKTSLWIEDIEKLSYTTSSLEQGCEFVRLIYTSLTSDTQEANTFFDNLYPKMIGQSKKFQDASEIQNIYIKAANSIKEIEKRSKYGKTASRRAS